MLDLDSSTDSDERDVAALLAGLDALVVVVDGDGQGALGGVLADHVALEEIANLDGLGQLVELDVIGVSELLFDDLVAQVDAFVADVHAGTRDELLDLLLALSAERALQQVTAVSDARHVLVRSLLPLRRRSRKSFGRLPDATRLSRKGRPIIANSVGWHFLLMACAVCV